MLLEDMAHVMGEQQYSTASLIATQINQEIEVRIDGLERVAKGITAASMAKPAILQADLEDHPVLNALFNEGVACAGADGVVRADFPQVKGRVGANFLERDYIWRPLKEGRVTVGKAVRSKLTGNPSFVIGVPVKDGTGAVIGVLGGVINLGEPNFLDRVTHGHYGKSGGYMLVSKQHRLIITASDKALVMQPLSVPGVSKWIDSHVDGFDGTNVFVNAQGVEELNSIKGIPIADWYVVTYLPTDEAFAPIDALRYRMLFATLVLTILAGMVMWWVLTRQFAPMTAAARLLRAALGNDHPASELPVTTRDEIGDLIGGVNRLLRALGDRERVLAESEKRFEDIAKASADWIWEVDAGGRFTFASDTVEKVLGFKSTEVIGKTPFDFMPDKEAERVGALFETILSNRESFRDLENINVHKDGRLRHIQTNGVPVLDKEGKLLGFRGLDRDVTDRKLAEDKVRDSEHRYRRLADNSPLAIQQFAPDGTTVRVNAAWERLWRTPFSALREYNVLQDQQLDRLGILPLLRRAFDGESVEFPEHKYDKAQSLDVASEPGQLWLRAFAYAVRNDDGQVVEVVLVQEDITARKSVEEELQSLYRSIDALREEDRRKIARELHDDLGHRLTTLKIDIDRLEMTVAKNDPAVAARLAEFGESVIEVVDAVRRISEDLRPGMLDVLGLVAALENLASNFSRRSGIQCQLTTTHEEVKVADEIAIGIFRIAQEALNNALKYAGATQIRIDLRCSDEEIGLVVEDNGKGLPGPAEGDRRGFGLIGMRERVGNLNGTFAITSQLGQGVRIEAVIPV